MKGLHIGTSGWSYAAWKGLFYPEDIGDQDMLRWYAGRFSSVEINNSFYKLPERETLQAWREAVPEGFVFTAKASRYITHMKKLRDAESTVPGFVERIEVLGDRLGPILFQLPPRWHCNLARLEDFLECLGSKHRHAFEFRDPSWFGAATWKLLERHGAAACIYELDGRVSPKEVTANFVYVRLHGPDGPYKGSYDAHALSGWAGALSSWQRQGCEVYCYFDNDEHGYAAANALRLERMLRGDGEDR